MEKVFKVLNSFKQNEKLQEIFSKELEDIKDNQVELKNTISEMKNILERINTE